MPRLLDKYKAEVVPALMTKFNYKNVMQVPKLDKIVINMACGDAVGNAKVLESAMADLTTIAGQKPVITRARKSLAAWKLRKGMAIGCKVTLRGSRMYDFLDKFMNIALPRVRDFRGVNPNSFDGRGTKNSSSSPKSNKSAAWTSSLPQKKRTILPAKSQIVKLDCASTTDNSWGILQCQRPAIMIIGAFNFHHVTLPEIYSTVIKFDNHTTDISVNAVAEKLAKVFKFTLKIAVLLTVEGKIAIMYNHDTKISFLNVHGDSIIKTALYQVSPIITEFFFYRRIFL